jgi:RNA polymerase sigma-70 factor (ECF subfamily)
VIYLLFNEGYNSTNSEKLVRTDIMQEAKTLCKLLTENEHTQLPEVFALMSLICFHTSRNESRLTSDGEMILLESQDRTKWNRELIDTGNDYMNKAAFGSVITSYHLEAAIAFEHCMAPGFAETNWQRILVCYEWLIKIAPSPVTELNKIAVVMQVHGAAVALEHLQASSEMKKLKSWYLYYSLLGEIYSRLGEAVKAKENFIVASGMTGSEIEKKMLNAKVTGLSGDSSPSA